jgi:hypothetical protein
MQGLTVKEARKYCMQSAVALRVADLGSLFYDGPEEYAFVIETPEEHRMMVTLALAILSYPNVGSFEGGLLWLTRWQIGTNQMVRPGWRIIEDMRRAHGELRSLDIAPAQYFRHDEFVELHAFLIETMAYGWAGFFVAAGFFINFQESGKIRCVATDVETLDKLFSALQRWNPLKLSQD